MKKNKLLLSLCTSFIVSMSLICTSFAAITPERMGGQGRYETCTSVSQKGWNNKTCAYAIIATGQDYPDALSAAPLAKKFNAPIFLVSKDNLDNNEDTSAASVSSELQRLNVQKVFIIGGTGVVSEKVENQLKNLNITYERLGGANREETSLKVAEKIGTSNGIMVTTGSDFTDALSVSSIAALSQMPIVLINNNSVRECVSNFVKNNSIPKTYIIGDENIISSSVDNNFNNVERIQGSSASERNINAIKSFKNKLDLNKVFFATLNDYPDGLCGSAIASLTSSPIILVNENLPKPVQEFLSENGDTIKSISLLGGNGVVSDSLSNNLGKIIEDNSSLKIISID